MHMQTVQLNISSDILDKVMFFLENLPKNKVQFTLGNSVIIPSENGFNPRDFFGVAQSSKAEIDAYLMENQNDWDSYIDER
ncbi:MAG TPA: hypothetical protein ENK86_05560 [Campylobacterales bacterium]|nr:hypothetical protein [Campylobacterales bacterium]